MDKPPQSLARRITAAPSLKSIRNVGALTFHWDAFQPRAAISCIPAILLVLIVGLALDQKLLALVAAAGAFSVGLGAFQHLFASRSATMLAAIIGTSLGGAIGTIAGSSALLQGVCAALAALCLGLFSPLGTGAWWLALQCAIALVVAASFPADAAHAALRGLLIGVGGLLQLCLCLVAARLGNLRLDAIKNPFAKGMPGSAVERKNALGAALRPSFPRLNHTLALVLLVGGSAAAAHGLASKNGYWLPMTLLIIFRPDPQDTFGRTLMRVGGTVVGAGAASTMAVLLHPTGLVLVPLIATLAWCCYAMQWVNYGLFSLFITAYVAFLFDFANLPEPEVALHRVVATAIAGGLALVASRLISVASTAGIPG